MFRFDEQHLISALNALPHASRVAFAAATATRQIVSCGLVKYDEFSASRLNDIVSDLWRAAQNLEIDEKLWSGRLEDIMNMMPSDEVYWDIWHALADDCLSSLTYAIRCLLNQESQDAAWAARRAYEAVDQVAIRLLGLRPGEASAETGILSHEVVQREVSNQKKDLLMLRAGLFDEVKQNSFNNPSLTKQDVDALTLVSKRNKFG